MISNTRQNWTVGHNVKVGFMTLKVRNVVPNMDGGPDAYILSNLQGTQLYRFTPHFGVSKITVEEAKQMIEFKNRCEAARASRLIMEAAQVATIDAIFA